MLARSARALIGFGVVTAGILLAVGNLVMPMEFFRDNLIPHGPRMLLLGSVIGAFVVSFAFGFLLVFREPERTVPAIEWLVRLLCPVLLTPILLALLRHEFASDVEEALLLALLAIGTDRLARVSLEAWHERPAAAPPIVPSLGARLVGFVKRSVTAFTSRPRLVLLTVIALAAGHAIFMSIWAVWSHQRFSTYGYDLGQYDQIFASTLHGKWLAVPSLGWPENWGELNGHADFGTFYMLPIYALHPRAETLLVMQAVVLAGASIPVYLFSKNRLPTGYAFIMALVWLTYPPIHGAQLYDIHMQPFGASWAVAAICAVDYKKWKLYWLFFTLAILCREDVSIGLTVLGLFLVLSGHRVKTGVATMAVAGLYFVGLRFVLMKNTGFANVFKDLYAPGEPQGFGSIIKTLISNPAFVGKTVMSWEKIRYFCQLLAPLAFLPLRRPLLWVLMLPGFILTLLSTQYLPTIQISFQYVCNWAGYMIPATAVALSLYDDGTATGRLRRTAAAIALVVAATVASVQWGAYSPHPSVRGGFVDVPFAPPTQADKDREAALQEIMKKVPEGARLCTSDRVQAHTTYFLNNWSLKDGLWDCEYLIWSNVWGDLGSERGAAEIATGRYEVLEQKAGITFAKKKAPPPNAP